MKRFGKLSSALAFAVAASGILVGASEAAQIIVGSQSLLPNQANQTVKLFVTGGDAIQGLNFNAQIADGGPGVGGSVAGPAITGVNLTVGTIFDGNNSGVSSPGSFPQLAIRVITTSTGTVAAAGLLAELTIDTTGFASGNWSLSLKNTLNGPSDFVGIPITITDGTISATAALLGDVNLDGIVDQLDLNAVNEHWQQTGVGLALGDANQDGVVDQLDLNSVNEHWQQTVSPRGSLTAVPEPTGLAVCLSASLLMHRRSRLGRAGR